MDDQRPLPFWLVAMIAASTGFGAASTLLLSTLAAAQQGGIISPGVIATAQAGGVFLGCVAANRSGDGRHDRTVACVVLALAGLCCFLLSQAGLPGFLTPLALAATGLGIGFSVTALDKRVAMDAAHRAASAVLYVGLFAAVGALAAPLLWTFHAGSPEQLLIAPAAAFLVALIAWFIVAPGGRSVSTASAAAPAIGPMLCLAFVFGFVDNGVLSLAPAFFAGNGVSVAEVSWIAVGALGGAAVVQLIAVVHAESAAEPAERRWLLACCLGTALVSLLALAVSPNVAANALFLVVLGAAIDIVYGLGLYLHIRNSTPTNPAGAVASYVCAAALGEVVGPMLLDSVRDTELSGLFFLIPAVLVAVSLLATADFGRSPGLAFRKGSA